MQLVEEAIARVGGKATVLCGRLHFGASSVSEWRRGVRPIPQNERRRLEEFVRAPEHVRDLATIQDPIEAFVVAYQLNPEVARLRQARPDILAAEWDPYFQSTVNQAKRERDEIMLRTGRTLDDRLRLLSRLVEKRK